MTTPAVTVRGAPSAEEVAAVISAVGARRSAEETSAYQRWRRVRLAAVAEPARPPRTRRRQRG